MEKNCKYFTDKQGRLVRRVERDGKKYFYYVGVDAQGFIRKDKDGEYIVVGEEKRYWRGILEKFPDELLFLNDFNICILKPDAHYHRLHKEISSILKDQFSVIAQQSMRLDKTKIFKLYPYFFTKDWETELLNYLTAGASSCFLLSGYDIFRRMLEIRNYVRVKYNVAGKHPVFNFIHCADNKEEAIRESLLFFDSAELVSLIGMQK